MKIKISDHFEICMKIEKIDFGWKNAIFCNFAPIFMRVWLQVAVSSQHIQNTIFRKFEEKIFFEKWKIYSNFSKYFFN